MNLRTMALAMPPMFLIISLAIFYSWFGQQVFDAVLIPVILVAAVTEIVVWYVTRARRTAPPASR